MKVQWQVTVSSDAEFDSTISAMVKGSIANPKVGPEQWFQFVSKARAEGMRADDDWIYKVGPELITEFGAPGAGTALSSLYQGIVSCKLTKSALGEMDQSGAFKDDEGKVVRDKNGNVVRVHPGAMGVTGDTFTANPGEGIQHLIDLVDAKLTKDNGGKALDDAGRKKGEEDWLTNVFGNRNAAQMAMTLAEQKARLGRGAQAADNAADNATAAANVRAGDPNFAMAQFSAALSNLAATMGTIAMPAIVASMQQLGTAAEGAAKFLGMLHSADDATKKYTAPLNDLVGGNWGDIWGDTVHALTPDEISRGGHSGPHPRNMMGPFTPSGVALGGGADNARLSAAAAMPVTLQPTVTMTTLPVSITVDNGGMLGAVTKLVDARITAALSGLTGMFKSGSGNSSAGFDGRAAPSTPDGSIMHGSH
jgi:hypothetical protein